MSISHFLDLLHDESGNTAIEYGIILVLIAVAIVGSITALGGTLAGVYTSATASLAR